MRAAKLVMTVALSLGATAAAAQMELGVMQGMVTDESGRPLEGATLRLRDLERGREIAIKSDKSGRFYRRGLQAVEYEMIVEKEGYQPITDKVKLVAGTDRRFDFKLAKAAPEGADEFAQGVAAFNKGDNAAAVQAFEAAVQKAPNLPEVRVNLALAYLRLARTADAVAQLEKAASLGPNDARVQFQLGGAYVEMQALDKAVAAFEAGLAKQPNLTEPLSYEAAVTLGAVYFAQGHNDKAAAQFEKTLAMRPGAAAPALGMAKVLFSKGDVAKALQLFEQIVSSHPGTPEATQAEAFVTELRKGKPPGAYAAGPASAATITVLSAGAVEPALVKLAGHYKRETGHEVKIQFGTGPELAARLSSGEAADVLIAPPAVVDQAAKAGAALAGTQVAVGRVGVGVTVRRGASVPNVETVDALKDALLRADSVVYNQASTGLYLEKLFTQMGILEQLKAKTTRYGNAAQVLEHVIAGKGNEIGFGPITEIKSFEPKGLVLVAPLPADVQNYTTYVAVVMRSARAAAARDFIRYLTTAAARETFAAAGVH